MLQVANQIEQLDQYYVFEEKERVISFIEQNPALLDLLLEAPAQIKRFFPNAPIILRLRPDYDNPGKGELWIYIQNDEDDPDGVDKLKELSEQWWLDAAGSFGFLVGLNLD
jgi:hypothetical protein